MKSWIKSLIFLAVLLVLTLVWLVYFHNEGVRAKLVPKWDWLQKKVEWLGKKEVKPQEADEEPDTSLNTIPVHVAKITVATMHRYIEGFGTITPRPARADALAGSADVAAPVAGVVAKLPWQVGQKVKAGEMLIQLDDRVAKTGEDQAQAAVAQAEASLAALKATPRPEQIDIAQLAIEKARATVDVTQKNYERQKTLAAGDGASGKSVEQAAADYESAKSDLAVAQRQMDLLKATPTPQDLAQEQAKVAQANAALASAKVQRQLLTVAAPIDGTIVAINVNPGDSVDPTKTLVQIVAMDRLMVDVDVPADQLPTKAEGLSADILPVAAVKTESNSAVVGTVAFVSPQVDPKNGTVMVGIGLPGGAGDAPFRPGLTVRVRIIAAEHKDALVVPREAVVEDENLNSVIALVETGTDEKTKEEYQQATRKTVQAGIEENGMIEIIQPDLKEGMTVVTAGAFGLPQATRVKVQQ